MGSHSLKAFVMLYFIRMFRLYFKKVGLRKSLRKLLCAGNPGTVDNSEESKYYLIHGIIVRSIRKSPLAIATCTVVITTPLGLSHSYINAPLLVRSPLTISTWFLLKITRRTAVNHHILQCKMDRW